MKSVAVILEILSILSILCVRLVSSFDSSIDLDGTRVRDFGSRNEPNMVFKYDRIDEVKKECSSILPPIESNHKPYGKRLFRLKEKLSFVNGDWWEESGKSPLMPFDNKFNGVKGVNGSQDQRSPLNLISFWVTDVDRAHRSKNSVSINGVLQLGITIGGLFESKRYNQNPEFNIYPGNSELTISFQGIVAETEENNGETVMCLLGNTMLPYRYPDSNNPWDWVKEPGYINQPPLIQDDRILLTIRYPKTFTLIKRGIYGSLKSLNPKSNQKFFDEVHISASLSSSANYEFSSQKLVSKACDPYPYKDDFVDAGVGMYKGTDFCLILERFTGQDPLTIVPNWRCNGTDEYCGKLGPFETDDRIKATNGSFKGVELSFQDLRCEEPAKKGGISKVAVLIRVVSPSEDRYNAAQRTGLNNMTLSAEGMWESSSGQLCMVGCRGVLNQNRDQDQEIDGCDSRVCLYIPLSFSIKQRSIILGTISSVKAGNQSFFPLAFEKIVRPSELYDQYTESRPYYEYSKIELAGTVLEKTEPFSFGTVIKKSILTFPKVEDADSFLVGLSLLAEDLTLHHPAVLDSTRFPARTDVQVEILSLGPLFGHYWSLQNDSSVEEDTPYHSQKTYTERQLLLNVSAQISLSGPQFGNFSNLFVEGLYHPLVGKMYLVGCRDVRASWRVLYESSDLEDGLDCLIEVVVSYPPTTTRWLVNPTATISVSSQRNEVDPLYFKPVKIQTVPIMYRAQREDVLSRRGVEGILRVLTLSIAIGCILSQLFYVKENPDSVPYVSVVMLAVQALGYGIPLVTEAEALFKKSEMYENSSVLERSQMIRVIDYTVKILVLVSFSLTLRIFQKVWRSRVRLLTRAPLEPNRVPSDRRVFLVTGVIHLLGFVIVLIVHGLRFWLVELEEYVGLIQDLFLFPQVIGNLIWRIDCKPLRKSYFVGITVIRLLPHIYDYVRTPIPNPFFSEDYEFVNPHLDFYSRISDIAIPATAIVLAIVVYGQQKWGYEKLGGVLGLGRFSILPRRSAAYERLPPVAAEAELTSGVNGGGGTGKEVEVE